jgi:hypothetical protein
MYEYILLIGNFMAGIERAVGPFESEQDAELWLGQNPVEQGQNSRIVCIERP